MKALHEHAPALILISGIVMVVTLIAMFNTFGLTQIILGALFALAFLTLLLATLLF